MEVNIKEVRATRDDENGYVGSVLFEVTGHKTPYELTLQSKKGNDWSYSLIFTEASGAEEDILAVEEALEEDDELFDFFVDAVKSKL
ncbi:hypothetical protein [Paenibacillus sp. MBLB4367]|uniref:hypothetical protein n=1 Tax=Paenibacillus sp. MBLB4367 TaxID=3384767 RepID=UPI0039081E63